MSVLKAKIAALKVKESLWLRGYKTRANLGSTLAVLAPKRYSTKRETRKAVGLLVTRTR